MTNWTKPLEINSVLSRPSPLQNDLGAGLDELLNRMTDENDNVILFHNWEFYDAPTQWQKEESL